MRNIKFILFALFVAVTSLNLSAQLNQKVGHINSVVLLSEMPEYKQAQMDLEAYSKKLEGDLSALAEEYQKFAADLQPQMATMSDLIKETKLKELQDKERRIQEFQYDAQRKVQEKEAELYKPIEEKAMNAIKAVADRQGFSYIINSASLLHAGSGNIDILPMVKSQLGIF